MNSATFWNDQEKAKGVIQEVKTPEHGAEAVRGSCQAGR